MIDRCNHCGYEFRDCNCEKRKTRSNMVDASIFLEAWDETNVAGDCRLILEGAKNQRVFIGHVSTIILGEIMKKLLKLKKQVDYRYEEIYKNILESLLHFRIVYICEETIQKFSEINVRGGEQSQDKINLACAIKNKCNMFIIKDSNFTINQKIIPTTLIEIRDKQNKKLKALLEEIKSLQPIDG